MEKVRGGGQWRLGSARARGDNDGGHSGRQQSEGQEAASASGLGSR